MTIKTKTSQSQMTRRLVRNMRKTLGLAVADLARRANVPLTKLYAWEQGKRKLRLEEFGRMATILVEILDERGSPAKLQAASQKSGGVYAKEYRRMHGITQFEVAREAKLSQTTISLYEKGYLDLATKEKQRIDAALDKLRARHEAVANERKLFRDIEASLRRELMEKEEQTNQRTMKLSSLLGGEATAEAFKNVSLLRGERKTGGENE